MNQSATLPVAPKLQLCDQRALFSTPLFTYLINGHEALNAQLIDDIHRLRQQSEGIKSSNQYGWHSERDFFERPEASFRATAQQFLTALVTTTITINPELDREAYSMHVKGWINVNERGAYNTPHDHPNHILSGVYYVKAPERDRKDPSRSGSIEFIDSRGLTVLPHKGELILGNAKCRLRPQAGMLLIFPSPLLHWVYPHEEDEERISIAFNMRLDRRCTQEESPEV